MEPRRRHVAIGLLVLLLFFRTTRADDAPTPPETAPLMAAEGFTVERVANDSLIRHPMYATFDDEGRLYVAESSGENLDQNQLAATNPGRIRRLVDLDGDGRFDRATDFATNLTMPMGVQWCNGGLYVAAPPDILRLDDHDGDGVAEDRTIIVTGFIYNGNGADNHGPFLGPDGWLYFTHGRHGYKITTKEGTVLEGLASRVFRCQPDGTRLERVCGGGMDNPVEVAFLRSGEMFGTMTFFTDPKNGMRDSLMHWVEGGVYPKIHPCLQEFERTGPLLPALREWPAVAPSGLMVARGGIFQDDATHLLTAQFNTRRVQHHPITRRGAGFVAEDHDLLTTDDPDFHPTDILEDADGSLLVVNTGGWFLRGCPRSKIAKPDIHGAIYRIQRQAMPRPNDPRGLALDWTNPTINDLMDRLADPRFVVRDRAVEALVRKGDEAVEPLAKAIKTTTTAIEPRIQALWVLGRIGSEPTHALIRQALDDPSPEVRIAACRIVGLAGDRDAAARLATMLSNDEPPVRRQAATALGQIQTLPVKSVPAIIDGLRASAADSDPFLEHALIRALIDFDAPALTRLHLTDASPAVRRGVLIALDQMPSGKLALSEVLPLLDTSDATLRAATLSVIEHHPDWAPEMIGHLERGLREPVLNAETEAALRGIFLAFESQPSVQTMLARALGDPKTSPAHRLLLLDVFRRSRLTPLPDSWVSALKPLVESKDTDVVRAALAAIRAQRIDAFDDPLAVMARDPSRPVEIRLAALGVIAPRLDPLPGDLFDVLVERLRNDEPPVVRLSAAETLGASSLSPTEALRLTALLAEPDPLVTPSLLRAFRRPLGPTVGRALVEALSRRADSAGLSGTALADLLKNYPDEVSREARPLLDRLVPDAADAKAKLEALAPLAQGGHPDRGRAVFFGNRASCYGCHRVGPEGGNIGPDLTTIGAVRSGRDLLEAIVYPSATFAQGFDPFVVATSDGRILNGVIAQRDGNSIVLRTTDRAEIHLRPEEVDEIRPSPTSIMPQGLDTTLSRDELRDLLAFLQGLK